MICAHGPCGRLYEPVQATQRFCCRQCRIDNTNRNRRTTNRKETRALRERLAELLTAEREGRRPAPVNRGMIAR